jgi:hypothetical protein
MDDQNAPNEPAVETPVQAPELDSAPSEVESSQSNGSMPVDLPPEAPESPINTPTSTPVESQNGGVNQPEGEVSEAPIPESAQPVSDQTKSQPAPSAPTPPTSPAPQPQSSAQSPQAPTPATPQNEPINGESVAFRNIQARGRSKIQSNRQEKLDKLIQFAEKKQIIDNEETQKLLLISSATATRYLEDLVKEGRMISEGSPRHAKYRFIR